MKIRRTYKKTSLKFGEVEIVDEVKAREVFGQTSVAHHAEGVCGKDRCHYCAKPALDRLLAGGKVETFFSIFEKIAA